MRDYAEHSLTAKDMEEGYKKDGAAFTFAAILNTYVHRVRTLRNLMEEEYLEDAAAALIDRAYLAQRWREYDEQLRKKWPNSIRQCRKRMRLKQPLSHWMLCNRR